METLVGDPGWINAFRLPLLGRLLLSLVLGMAVGLERELSGKPAGLRTNILICVGATLLTELSILAASGFAAHDLIRADPARIAAQIVSGIGFIGAGTILVSRGHVLGLTTAATLWVVAAIGMTVGLHLYVEAVGATVLVVLTLFVLGRFEERVLSERSQSTLEVTLRAGELSPEQVVEMAREQGFDVRRVGYGEADGEVTLSFVIRGPVDARDSLLRRLSGVGPVIGARIE